MKPFSDTITRLGRRAFDTYMGGSMNSPLYGMDLNLVAWIYGVRVAEVTSYLEQELRRLQDAQYAKYKNKT